MFELIGIIVVGFLAGLIARAITPGDGPKGFFLTAVLGIAGSFVATYAGSAMGWYKPGEAASFIGAVVGSAVLLIVYHIVSRRK